MGQVWRDSAGRPLDAVCNVPPYYTDNLMHNLRTERFFTEKMINRRLASADGLPPRSHARIRGARSKVDPKRSPVVQIDPSQAMGVAPGGAINNIVHQAVVAMLKKIVNLHEKIVDLRLRAVCDERGARVCPKVRVADVLPIEGSGILDADYSFALKSHFDFVVTDRDHSPLLAIEFDGPQHDAGAQAERDGIKNRLAERFALPLLRIRSAHLNQKYDGWDLLSWIVDVWFIQNEADRMYEAGELPPDFDFQPSFIIASPNHKRRYPYWLGFDARQEIQQLHKRGQILDELPPTYTAVDANDNLHALAFLRIDESTGVRATTAMRSQRISMDLSEPMDGILVTDLLRELEAALHDAGRRIPLAQIQAEIASFVTRYKLIRCNGVASPKGP